MPKPNHPSGKGPSKPKAAAAEPVIPENYVDFAEQLMKENCALITKTKIQNLLRLACDVYNNENRRTEERLLKESVNQIEAAAHPPGLRMRPRPTGASVCGKCQPV